MGLGISTREDQEAMDKIVLKAVCGDISLRWLFEVKEIIYGYYQEKQEKKRQ